MSEVLVERYIKVREGSNRKGKSIYYLETKDGKKVVFHEKMVSTVGGSYLFIHPRKGKIIEKEDKYLIVEGENTIHEVDGEPVSNVIKVIEEEEGYLVESLPDTPVIYKSEESEELRVRLPNGRDLPYINLTEEEESLISR